MSDQTTVNLTRRRWSIYVLPGLLLVIIVSVYCAWETGEYQLALAPIGVFCFWSMLLWFTPRAGMACPTIGATPGASVMLWSFAVGFALFGVAVAVDSYVFNKPFHDPLERYHVVLFAPAFCVFILGIYKADRIARKAKVHHHDSQLKTDRCAP